MTEPKFFTETVRAANSVIHTKKPKEEKKIEPIVRVQPEPDKKVKDKKGAKK